MRRRPYAASSNRRYHCVAAGGDGVMAVHADVGLRAVYVWSNIFSSTFRERSSGIRKYGHVVLDGDPAPTAAPPHFRPMPIVSKRSPISATAELLLPELVGLTVSTQTCLFTFTYLFTHSGPATNQRWRRLSVCDQERVRCGTKESVNEHEDRQTVSTGRHVQVVSQDRHHWSDVYLSTSFYTFMLKK